MLEFLNVRKAAYEKLSKIQVFSSTNYASAKNTFIRPFLLVQPLKNIRKLQHFEIIKIRLSKKFKIVSKNIRRRNKHYTFFHSPT